jgi:hypothetical protein
MCGNSSSPCLVMWDTTMPRRKGPAAYGSPSHTQCPPAFGDSLSLPILQRMLFHSSARMGGFPTRTWNWQQRYWPSAPSLRRHRTRSGSPLAHSATTPPRSVGLNGWPPSPSPQRPDGCYGVWHSCSIVIMPGASPPCMSLARTTSWPTLHLGHPRHMTSFDVPLPPSLTPTLLLHSTAPSHSLYRNCGH